MTISKDFSNMVLQLEDLKNTENKITLSEQDSVSLIRYMRGLEERIQQMELFTLNQDLKDMPIKSEGNLLVIDFTKSQIIASDDSGTAA